jgi:L-aspartate oxidase
VLAFPAGGSQPDPALVAELRVTMSNDVGVVRTGAGLTRALRKIAALEAAGGDCEAFRNMTATATLITAAALSRHESRGGHYRSDYPAADPALAQRSHFTFDQALEIRAGAVSETADVA